MKRTTVITIMAISLFFVGSGLLSASAFSIWYQGALASAFGGAFVARADSPIAIFYNPAGISWLTRDSFSIGASLIKPTLRYTPPGGTAEEARRIIHYPLNIYYAKKISDNLSAGVGFYTPFQLSTEWSAGFTGRFASRHSEVITYCLNPVVAYKYSPQVSIAFGLNLYYSNLYWDKGIDLSSLAARLELPSLPEGDFTFDGHDFGIGYSLGLFYAIDDYWSLGVSYRSPLNIKAEGNVDYGIPNTGYGEEIDNLLLSLYPDQSGTLELRLPHTLTIGVSTSAINRCFLEADIQWTGWSSFDTLVIDLSQPTDEVGDEIKDRKWKNAFALRFGFEFEATKMIRLRGGYINEGSPVPNRTLDPFCVSSFHQAYCGGVGIVREQMDIDLSYMGVFYKDRRVSNELLSGDYEGLNHVIALSLTLKF